jgi:hypothetical protein
MHAGAGCACARLWDASLHRLKQWHRVYQPCDPEVGWRYDYNNVRPHSSLENQTPAQARRAFEQFKGSVHDGLAQTDDEEYQIQTRKLSL